LAHRRNANAVWEDYLTQAKLAEQMRHAMTFRCLGVEWARGSCNQGQPFLAAATVGIRAALFKHILEPEGAEGVAESDQATLKGNERCAVIDASRDVQRVADDAWTVVRQRLKL
jgi:hypothetical protein